MKGIIASLIFVFSTQVVAGYYAGKIQQMEFGPLYGDIVYVALPQTSANLLLTVERK